MPLCVADEFLAAVRATFLGRANEHRVIAGPVPEKVEDLRTLVELAAQGVIEPVIDQSFPFTRIGEAYCVVDSGRKQGSVVVTFAQGA